MPSPLFAACEQREGCAKWFVDILPPRKRRRDSHPREWAFLLRWKLRKWTDLQSRLTSPPQALAFPEPQGSFSVLLVRGLDCRPLIRDMVLVSGRRKRETLVQHGSVFTRDPSSLNPYTIQFAMYYSYILTGCKETGNPRCPRPRKGTALSSQSPKGRRVFSRRFDKISFST